jgi:hypothetical protein
VAYPAETLKQRSEEARELSAIISPRSTGIRIHRTKSRERPMNKDCGQNTKPWLEGPESTMNHRPGASPTWAGRWYAWLSGWNGWDLVCLLHKASDRKDLGHLKVHDSLTPDIITKQSRRRESSLVNHPIAKQTSLREWLYTEQLTSTEYGGLLEAKNLPRSMTVETEPAGWYFIDTSMVQYSGGEVTISLNVRPHATATDRTWV